MSAAAAGAVAAAAIANAIKASGAIVQVSPEDFQKILLRSKDALVVCAEGGFFSKKLRYLVGHRGLIFFTKSAVPLDLPSGTEIVLAQKIWIPG